MSFLDEDLVISQKKETEGALRHIACFNTYITASRLHF